MSAAATADTVKSRNASSDQATVNVRLIGEQKQSYKRCVNGHRSHYTHTHI